MATPVTPPAPAAAAPWSIRSRILASLAVLVLLGAVCLAIAVPRLRQGISLLAAGLSLGAVRWWLFRDEKRQVGAVPFSGLRRMFTPRRKRFGGAKKE